MCRSRIPHGWVRVHWFFLLVFPDSLGNFEQTVSEAFCYGMIRAHGYSCAVAVMGLGLMNRAGGTIPR